MRIYNADLLIQQFLHSSGEFSPFTDLAFENHLERLRVQKERKMPTEPLWYGGYAGYA